MKRSYLSRVVGAGVVAASLAILPLAAPARADSQNTNTYTTTSDKQNSSTTSSTGTACYGAGGNWYDGMWMTSQEGYLYDRHGLGEQMIRSSDSANRSCANLSTQNTTTTPPANTPAPPSMNNAPPGPAPGTGPGMNTPPAPAPGSGGTQ